MNNDISRNEQLQAAVENGKDIAFLSDHLIKHEALNINDVLAANKHERGNALQQLGVLPSLTLDYDPRPMAKEALQLLGGVATGIGNSLSRPLQEWSKSPYATNESFAQLADSAKNSAEYIGAKIGNGDYGTLSDDAAKVVNKLADSLSTYEKKPPFERGNQLGEAAAIFLPVPFFGKLSEVERIEQESLCLGRMLKSCEHLTSAKFRLELKEAQEKLFPRDKEFLERQGISILGVRRLTDVMDKSPTTMGVYRHGRQQIFIAEETKSATGWEKHQDLSYVLSHEVGHAVDLNRGGEGKALSDAEGFLRAFKSDMAALSKEQRECLDIGFRDQQHARREIFASQYARLSGSRSNSEFHYLVQEWFTNSLKYLRGELNDAKK